MRATVRPGGIYSLPGVKSFTPGDFGGRFLFAESAYTRVPRSCAPWPEDIAVVVTVATITAGVLFYTSEAVAKDASVIAAVLAGYTAPALPLLCAALGRRGYTVQDVSRTMELVTDSEARTQVLDGFLPTFRAVFLAALEGPNLYEDALAQLAR